MILGTAKKIAQELEKNGISVTLIDMHTIKPLDTDILDEICTHKLVVTMEEHMKAGGLGSAIAEYYAEKEQHPLMQMFAVEDAYPNATEYEYLLEDCGLDADTMLKKISEKYEKVGR